MDDENNGFGFRKNRTGLDRCIGRWYFVHSREGSQIAGRISEVEGEFLYLNPSQSREYVDKNTIKAILVEEDLPIKLDDAVFFEPQTETSIRNYIDFVNAHREKNSKNQRTK